MKSTNKKMQLESLKRFIRKEVKIYLNETILTKPHDAMSDGYKDEPKLDTSKLQTNSKVFDFEVGEKYNWTGELNGDIVSDSCKVLCLGFDENDYSSVAFFKILTGSDKGQYISMHNEDEITELKGKYNVQ